MFHAFAGDTSAASIAAASTAGGAHGEGSGVGDESWYTGTEGDNSALFTDSFHEYNGDTSLVETDTSDNKYMATPVSVRLHASVSLADATSRPEREGAQPLAGAGVAVHGTLCADIGVSGVQPGVAASVGGCEGAAPATTHECDGASHGLSQPAATTDTTTVSDTNPITDTATIAYHPRGVAPVRGLVNAAAPLTATTRTRPVTIFSTMYPSRLVPNAGAGVERVLAGNGAIETTDADAVTLELKVSYTRAMAATALAKQVEARAKRALREHLAATAKANRAVAAKHSALAEKFSIEHSSMASPGEAVPTAATATATSAAPATASGAVRTPPGALATPTGAPAGSRKRMSKSSSKSKRGCGSSRRKARKADGLSPSQQAQRGAFTAALFQQVLKANGTAVKAGARAPVETPHALVAPATASKAAVAATPSGPNIPKPEFDFHTALKQRLAGMRATAKKSKSTSGKAGQLASSSAPPSADSFSDSAVDVSVAVGRGAGAVHGGGGGATKKLTYDAAVTPVAKAASVVAREPGLTGMLHSGFHKMMSKQ